jgi:phosphoglycolate phosphatase
MKYDAIIFDIDGTLWDARGSLAEAWNAGLANAGIDKRVSAREIESVLGNTTDVCIDILLPNEKSSVPGLKDVIEEKEIETIGFRGAAFYEGASDGIKDLAAFYKIFIASNCQTSYLRLFLEKSGLEAVLSGYDCYGMSGLPKGGMLAKMKKEHSLKDPVYVGDTAIDEEAAATAGMDFIHAAYGFGIASAKVNFDSFPALVKYLKKRGFQTSNLKKMDSKKYKYHHIGIPTNTPVAGEQYLADYKLFHAGYETSEFGIEWMRYETDCPLPEIVKTVPHLAFEVDDVYEAIKGKKVIIAPNSPSPGNVVAFIEENGAPIELIQTNNGNRG